MKTFVHSGNSGDVVYSIPTIHKLAGDEEKILYIKAARYGEDYLNQAEFCKALVEQQGIEVRAFTPENQDDWNYFKWPGLKFDYDLDTARHQRNRGVIHIVKRYFDTFGIHEDHRRPWLKVDDLNKREENFGLFHVTPRWNAYFCDWAKVYREARQRHDKLYFVGFAEDHASFQARYNILIDHIQTIDLLDIARLVRDADAIYMNQNPSTTLAQGLGKKYYLWPSTDGRTFMKTNCLMGTENENIIQADYLAANGFNVRPDSHIIR